MDNINYKLRNQAEKEGNIEAKKGIVCYYCGKPAQNGGKDQRTTSSNPHQQHHYPMIMCHHRQHNNYHVKPSMYMYCTTRSTQHAKFKLAQQTDYKMPI
eukprot:5578299-Amphidinium_carterae.1